MVLKQARPWIGVPGQQQRRARGDAPARLARAPAVRPEGARVGHPRPPQAEREDVHADGPALPQVPAMRDEAAETDRLRVQALVDLALLAGDVLELSLALGEMGPVQPAFGPSRQLA